MDATWFKKRQRQVGVTSYDLGDAIHRSRTVISRILNGYQKPTFEQAQIFAEKLDVALPEMLERLGLADPETARQLTPQNQTGDAAPWHADERSRDGPHGLIAHALGGGRPGVDIWRVRSACMALGGILIGDFILVDTHQRDTAKPGDVVIAQVYDHMAGSATTALRRLQPPVIISQSADPDDARVHVVDHNNVVIMGKVIGTWRTG